MLFREKYRIPSARWASWDYTAKGSYFVTICTKEMKCFFGEVIRGQMQLSEIGRTVEEEWRRTPEIRPDVKLDEWQVMPNHFHGILHIVDVETTRRAVSEGETFHRNASTETPHRETPHRGVSTIRPNSLGTIIGQFKAACTRRIWGAGHRGFAWQTRFFDRVVRNRDELEKIRAYIQHNPVMWDKEIGAPANLEL